MTITSHPPPEHCYHCLFFTFPKEAVASISSSATKKKSPSPPSSFHFLQSIHYRLTAYTQLRFHKGASCLIQVWRCSSRWRSLIFCSATYSLVNRYLPCLPPNSQLHSNSHSHFTLLSSVLVWSVSDWSGGGHEIWLPRPDVTVQHTYRHASLTLTPTHGISNLLALFRPLPQALCFCAPDSVSVLVLVQRQVGSTTSVLPCTSLL